MKISIIIPVYNAEQYLDKCLKSIVNQTLDLKDIEVLLIDDGSSDRSLEIAESYQNLIPHLNIVTQKNGGEAFARNVALELAKGEFITFLDNDDYYDDDTLKNALKKVLEGNLDILYLRIRQVNADGKFLQYFYEMKEDGVISHGLRSERRPFPATVYRREIVKDIKFPLDLLVGTDSVFNAIVQSKADRVAFTTVAIYNYTFRENSLSKKGFTEEGFLGFLGAIKLLADFRTDNFPKDDEDSKIFFENIMKVFVTRIIDLNIMPTFDHARYKTMRKVLREYQYDYLLKEFSTKYSYVDTSFQKFVNYQKYLHFKTKIYKLIHRA